MKPIYFPFTYISQPVARAVCSCFPQITVYQPSSLTVPEDMAQLADNHLIDIHTPIQNDEEQFDQLCKNYKNWIDIHQGTEIEFLKTEIDASPFFNDFSVSQIKADIKQKPAVRQPDPDIKARVFLKFTQDFDRQSIEIDQRFRSCEDLEQNLFNTLKGEDITLQENAGEPSTDAGGTVEIQGDYMTQERMAAWHRLMMHHKEISGLFITSSQTVWDFVIDRTPHAKKILEFDAIPIHWRKEKEQEKWQNNLAEIIAKLLNDEIISSPDPGLALPTSPGSNETVSFSLFAAPGEVPEEFFARLGGIDQSVVSAGKAKTDLKNTLFGYVKLNSQVQS